jgi:hypothetical protein
METTNQLLEQWREILEKILKYYASLPYRYGNVTNQVIVSRDLLAAALRDRNHFMLVHEGWENHRRIYGTITHAKIRDGKIWIHYDGIEDGITDELVA